MNYYEIDVKDSIIEPYTGLYRLRLLLLPQSGSAHSAGASSANRIRYEPFIDFVDRSFINRDSEIHRGVDLNVAYEDSWTLLGSGFRHLNRSQSCTVR